MLSILVIRNDDKSIASATVLSDGPDTEYRNPNRENRNNWKTFADAEAIAKALGPDFIAIDAGAHVSPRYDVIEMPKVGDPVSYAFNGDSYPCGHITHISDSKRVITTSSDEKNVVRGGTRKFWRRKLSGAWKHEGTWTLVKGHHYTQNPSF